MGKFGGNFGNPAAWRPHQIRRSTVWRDKGYMRQTRSDYKKYLPKDTPKVKFIIDTPKEPIIWMNIYMFQFIFGVSKPVQFRGCTLPYIPTKFPELLEGSKSYFYDACLKTRTHIPTNGNPWGSTGHYINGRSFSAKTMILVGICFINNSRGLFFSMVLDL